MAEKSYFPIMSILKWGTPESTWKSTANTVWQTSEQAAASTSLLTLPFTCCTAASRVAPDSCSRQDEALQNTGSEADTRTHSPCHFGQALPGFQCWFSSESPLQCLQAQGSACAIWWLGTAACSHCYGAAQWQTITPQRYKQALLCYNNTWSNQIPWKSCCDWLKT